jgi:hypothetical protein
MIHINVDSITEHINGLSTPTASTPVRLQTKHTNARGIPAETANAVRIPEVTAKSAVGQTAPVKEKNSLPAGLHLQIAIKMPLLSHPIPQTTHIVLSVTSRAGRARHFMIPAEEMPTTVQQLPVIQTMCRISIIAIVSGADCHAVFRLAARRIAVMREIIVPARHTVIQQAAATVTARRGKIVREVIVPEFLIPIPTAAAHAMEIFPAPRFPAILPIFLHLQCHKTGVLPLLLEVQNY